MQGAIAAGKIFPCRFLVGSGPLVSQAGRGQPLCGIMERYHKYPVVDSEAADRGDVLRYCEHGEIATLELGDSSCSPGDFLGSDEEGRGVNGLKHGDYYGGYAHQLGNPGDLIKVHVQCGMVGELIARQGPLLR